MLVLSRMKDERVVMIIDGRRMTVGVGRIRGDKVRLFFDVPDDVTVMREELQKQIDRKARSK